MMRSGTTSNKPLSTPDDGIQIDLDSPLFDNVPEPEIEQFKSVFKSAWGEKDSRQVRWSRYFNRVIRRPLLASAVLVIFTALLAGTGYWTALSGASKEYPKVQLLHGQKVIDRPELLSLIPNIEHPTVFSGQYPGKGKHKESYTVHGYLENQSVQVVWEF